jgi:hypothetical protein
VTEPDQQDKVLAPEEVKVFVVVILPPALITKITVAEPVG